MARRSSGGGVAVANPILARRIKTHLCKKLQNIIQLPTTKPLLVLLQDPQDTLEKTHLAGQDESPSGLEPELLLGLVQKSDEDGKAEEAGRDDEPNVLRTHVDGEKTRGDPAGRIGVRVGVGVGENGPAEEADGLPSLC